LGWCFLVPYGVISRKLDDRGGGLARIDGKVRLVEGLAMPREEDEFRLLYYNSLTTWISKKAVGRHDGVGGCELPVSGGADIARTAAERSGSTGRLAA